MKICNNHMCDLCPGNGTYMHDATGTKVVLAPTAANEGTGPWKHVKVFLVEEGSQQIEVEANLDLDSNKAPSISFRENRMEIGFGRYEQQADGSIDLKLTLVGDCTMSSNNIAGMTRIRCFIPASLRKD